MIKEKEYAKNTMILLIGKFSSQIISFLLLPLYTYELSVNSYGYIDLIQTYISLLAPLLLLQLDSAVFRYLIDIRDKENEKKKIISSSFFCIIFVIILSFFFFIGIQFFLTIEYYIYIIINMIALVLNTYAMSIARGNGHNKIYAIASIISSITTLMINLILIIIFRFGAKSILIAATISNILSFIYILKKEKIKNYIFFNCADKTVLSKLLKYSIPMIPNVLSWWIVGLSDRTIIVHFIGTAANGLYSVSCKFSNLLNSVFSIFSMSWQETASLHINDSDASEFFSKMIMNIFNIFLMASCAIIGLLPIIFNIVIGKEYLEAYNYIPILLTANICNVLVGLFGGIYVSKKMTKKVATTTIYSAVINIVINLIFIRKIGLYAACFSTLISYVFMIIYRYHDINKIIKINLYSRNNIIYICEYGILLVTYYLKFKILSFILCFVIILLYFIHNKNFALIIINNFFRKLKKD